MAMIELVLFIGITLIAYYATHQAVILLARKARDWMEAVAGVGGLLYLFGVYIAGFSAFNPSYIIAYALQALGVSLLLLPRIIRITEAALRDDAI